MILTTCKYFDLVGNRCSRVTDGKCNDLQDCEFKYIAELKAENDRLKKELDIALREENRWKSNFNNYRDVCRKQYQTLQEIKEYINAQGIDNKWNMRIQRFRSEILQKITKAEEE